MAHRSLLPAFALALLVPSTAAAERLLILNFEHEPPQAPTARLVNDLVAASVERHSSYDVVTGADLKRVVELESERRDLTDCSSDSCLVEIAGAMGADLIVFGQVGKLGDLFVVTLNLFDAAKSLSRGRRTIQVKDEGALPAEIDGAVGSLLGVQVEQAGPPLLGIGLLAGGVAVAGVGLVGAIVMNEALRDPSGTGKGTTFALGHVALWGGLFIGVVTATVGGLFVAGVLGGE